MNVWNTVKVMCKAADQKYTKILLTFGIRDCGNIIGILTLHSLGVAHACGMGTVEMTANTASLVHLSCTSKATLLTFGCPTV